ncbi:unnamed protein product [Prorocentrum cordatum]|nr:unnamed protein product [Polarella glacialis]
MPNLERNRRSSQGAVDAMAEALLISRAALFVRLVVGTSGFSTFAFLANALRHQTGWATSLPPLVGEGYMPNYVVTDGCGSQATCFRAPPKVRMADVTWHGKTVVERSCGGLRPEGCRAASSGCFDLRICLSPAAAPHHADMLCLCLSLSLLPPSYTPLSLFPCPSLLAFLPLSLLSPRPPCRCHSASPSRAGIWRRRRRSRRRRRIAVLAPKTAVEELLQA